MTADADHAPSTPPTPANDPPLLADARVIASAERRREPELPQATVEAALRAPLPTRLARYDVVLLAPAAPNTAHPVRPLADAFAAAGHRVLRPPPGGPSPVPIEALAALRHDEAIETAAMLVADPLAADAALAARRRWGWRIVIVDPLGPDVSVASGAPSPSDRLRFAADVVVGAEVAVPGGVIDPATGENANLPEPWRVADAAIRASFPLASVALVTWDGLAFTRLCLTSLLENTDYPNYEVIVVDNGSTDGTVAALRALAALHAHVRVVANPTNRGFGPANNQALAIANGDLLVLLNNDTIVPPGWLTRLAHHLDDRRLGLIGPATNRTGNEAQVDAPYATYGDFLRFARRRAAEHDGQRRPIRMPLMFCAAMRRDVFARVGFLDERYEQGMFEDEDYALRVKAAGFETAWAPDAYVHHAYHASVGRLLPSGAYTALFHANRRRFEAKWGICWERHRPPP